MTAPVATWATCPRCGRSSTADRLHSCNPDARRWYIMRLDNPRAWVPLTWDGREWRASSSAGYTVTLKDDVGLYANAFECAAQHTSIAGADRHPSLRRALKAIPQQDPRLAEWLEDGGAARVITLKLKEPKKLYDNKAWMPRKRWL